MKCRLVKIVVKKDGILKKKITTFKRFKNFKNVKNIVKKFRKRVKKNVEKMEKKTRKHKKMKKNQKKSLKNNQLYLYLCIYDVLPIFDQSWKKEYRRSSCLRELKFILQVVLILQHSLHCLTQKMTL